MYRLWGWYSAEIPPIPGARFHSQRMHLNNSEQVVGPEEGLKCHGGQHLLRLRKELLKSPCQQGKEM